jgi:hypothetical protein
MPRRLLVAWLPAVVIALVTPATGQAQMARLDLQLGLGRRDDALAAGATQATAEGSALSELALAGAWFGGGDSPLGVAARAALERFALRVAEPAQAADARVVVTGFEGRGGLAMRAPLFRRLRVEGALGYGVFQLPTVFVSQSGAAIGLAAATLRAHGPVLSASLLLGLSARFGVELGADAWPLGFGAEYGGVAVDPRRFALRGGLSFGQLPVGGTRLSGVLSAELSRASASGGGVHLTQNRQQLALALRATWPESAPGVTAPLPPPPPVTRPGPPAALPAPSADAAPAPASASSPSVPSVPSVITGLVRSQQTGAPVAARVRIVELGLDAAADERGAFALEVPPGQYTLVIEAAGYVPQTKAIRAASGEQNIYNVDLHAEVP